MVTMFQLDYIFGKIEESYEIHRPYISIELHASFYGAGNLLFKKIFKLEKDIKIIIFFRQRIIPKKF